MKQDFILNLGTNCIPNKKSRCQIKVCQNHVLHHYDWKGSAITSSSGLLRFVITSKFILLLVTITNPLIPWFNIISCHVWYLFTENLSGKSHRYHTRITRIIRLCCLIDELLADLHSATNTMKPEQGLNISNRSSSSSSSLPSQAYQAKLGSRERPESNDGEQYYPSSTSPRVVYVSDSKPLSHQPHQRYNVPGERLSSNSSQSRRDSDRYSVDSGASGDGPAPPLPPPPTQEVLDEASGAYDDEVSN